MSMKNKSILLIILWSLISSVALGGEIFGTLRENDKTVAKGLKVEIVTPAKTYVAATDAFGSYRLFVTEKGKCTLKVYYKDTTASFNLYSYDKSTRYDLSIETKDGKYFLKRK